MNTELKKYQELRRKIQFISEDDLRNAFYTLEHMLGPNDELTPEQDHDFTIYLEQLNITRDELAAYITLGAMNVS